MINFVSPSRNIRKSVHIHDLTVSVPFFGLDVGVKVSGRDPLECQNSGDLMKQDQI